MHKAEARGPGKNQLEKENERKTLPHWDGGGGVRLSPIKRVKRVEGAAAAKTHLIISGRKMLAKVVVAVAVATG